MYFIHVQSCNRIHNTSRRRTINVYKLVFINESHIDCHTLKVLEMTGFVFHAFPLSCLIINNSTHKDRFAMKFE